jgi:hypothetical protein
MNFKKMGVLLFFLLLSHAPVQAGKEDTPLENSSNCEMLDAILPWLIPNLVDQTGFLFRRSMKIDFSGTEGLWSTLKFVLFRPENDSKFDKEKMVNYIVNDWNGQTPAFDLTRSWVEKKSVKAQACQPAIKKYQPSKDRLGENFPPHPIPKWRARKMLVTIGEPVISPDNKSILIGYTVYFDKIGGHSGLTFLANEGGIWKQVGQKTIVMF